MTTAAGWIRRPPYRPTATERKWITLNRAIGEVYGLRVWRMDDFGRLWAKAWDKAGPWRPGVNVAKCHAEGHNIEGLRDPSGRGRKATDWEDGSTDALHKVEFAPTTHAVPDEACACGFYAYWDPRHQEAAAKTPSAWGSFTVTFGGGQQTQQSPYVLGVIKGTGRALIGTKGFRCEKAEIVALRDPTRGGRKTANWRRRQLAHLNRVYPDVPLLPSRSALLDFAPIEPCLPEPSDDAFWGLLP